MKKFKWQVLTASILALGILAVSQMRAFPLWLDAPTRSNPHDPKQTLFPATPVPVVLGTPTSTFTISPTQTISPTPTITRTITQTHTFSPTVNGTFTNTPTATMTYTPGSAPSNLIDDVEDADTNVIATGGRDGNWWTSVDGTDVPALSLVAAVGGYTGSYAIHATGGSTTPSSSWGGAVGFGFMSANAPYDASAFYGIKVYIKAGAGGQTALAMNVKDNAGYTLTKNITVTTSWALYEIDFNTNCLDKTQLTMFQVIPTNGIQTDLWLDDASFVASAPASCFTIPGTAPIANWPLYTGTGSYQKGPAGTGAAWAEPSTNPCVQGGCTGVPSSINNDPTFPHTPATNALLWHLSWNSGFWAGGGYNWAGWWDPTLTSCADGTVYDTLEFWIRGAVGGETAITVSLACSDGSGTAGGGSTNTITITGKYASCALTTTYQLVKIPLCDFDWSGGNRASIWEMDLSCGSADFGEVDIYTSDIYLQKY
jgi:hypothetical protein